MAINLTNIKKKDLVFYPTSLDKKLISKLRVIPDNKPKQATLKKIIGKPWGFEFPCYQNRYLDIWQFHINPESSTSFHCHPEKDALKIVLEGKITFETVRGKEVLSAGDTKLIKGFVLHRTSNDSDEIARILEIESPPDKKNLIRVNDLYGRQKLPYTFNPLKSFLTKDILVNSFFRLNKQRISENLEIFHLNSAKPTYVNNISARKMLGLRLKKSAKSILLRNFPFEFSGKDREFLLVLDGMLTIKNREGLQKMFPGDCCPVSDIQQVNALSIKTDALIW